LSVSPRNLSHAKVSDSPTRNRKQAETKGSQCCSSKRQGSLEAPAPGGNTRSACTSSIPSTAHPRNASMPPKRAGVRRRSAAKSRPNLVIESVAVEDLRSRLTPQLLLRRPPVTTARARCTHHPQSGEASRG